MKRKNAITIHINKRLLKKRLEDFIVITVWLLVNLMDVASFLLSFTCIFALIKETTITAIIILIVCIVWIMWRRYILEEK